MTHNQIQDRLVMASHPAAFSTLHFAVPGENRLLKFLASAFKQLVLILTVAALSFGVYQFVSHYVLKSVQVVGTSMFPTLQPNERYLMEPFTFQRREPRAGDIVVIRDPGDHGLSIKRIIATEGQSIHFKNGQVFVDGKKLSEPYLRPHMLTFTYSPAKEQLITCGKDQYFVLGDNRLVSVDSRSYGAVSREGILGLVKPTAHL